MRDPERVYAFLFLAHAALVAGYLSVAFRKPKGYRGRWSAQRLLVVSVVVNLLLLYPTGAFRTAGSVDVLGGIADPGEAYAASQEARLASNPAVEYVRIALGPILVMLLPLSVFYWRRLSRLLRLASVVGILGTVALFMAMGTNKAIVDTVLLLPWLVFASYVSGVSRLTRRAAVRLVAVGAVSIALASVFFANTQSTRVGSSASVGYFAATGTHADYSNFMIDGLPPEAQIGVLGLNSYLTQGYYALYLALGEPFVPMFGVGHSMFLYRQAARLTDDPQTLSMPYPVRIEKHGWDAYGLWSSIYPWIASDVSFPGAIVVVFLIGQLFALCWLDTLRGANPFAVVLLAQVLIMLFYFPANNQLMQSGEGLTSFWAIFAAWSITRRGTAAGVQPC